MLCSWRKGTRISTHAKGGIVVQLKLGLKQTTSPALVRGWRLDGASCRPRLGPVASKKP